MSGTPEPPVPNEIDLRSFDRMPFDVVKLLNSDIVIESSGDEFKSAVLLWARSWHQVPAGSLPDDDTKLAHWAGYGRRLKSWRRVRPGALRGFVKCSDGRLYHPIICEIAMESWAKKVSGKTGATIRWNQPNPLKSSKFPDANPCGTPAAYGEASQIARTEWKRTDDGADPDFAIAIRLVADELHRIATPRSSNSVHASAGSSDLEQIRGWLKAGYTAGDITQAAANIIGRVREIRNLWALLRKAMPEALMKLRSANACRLTADDMRSMARLYFAVGSIQVDGKSVGPPWVLKPKQRRNWPHPGAGPGEPCCRVPKAIFDQVANELCVPEADWPRATS